MTSLAISNATSSASVDRVGSRPPVGRPPGPPPEGNPLDSVAETLGLSAAELRTRLHAGATLNDLAESQGVSHEELIDAITAGMPSELTGSTEATQLAEQLAAAAGARPAFAGAEGGGGPVEHHGYGSAARVGGLNGHLSGVLTGSLTETQQTTLDSLSDLLDTDAQSLLTTLRSGTSLAELVAGQGIDSSNLAGILQDGLLLDAQS